MSCSRCAAALPLLLGFPQVGISAERHAVLLRCPSCGAFYEDVGEDWGGPREISVQEAKKAYGISDEPAADDRTDAGGRK